MKDFSPYNTLEALREGMAKRRGKPISDDAWRSWEKLGVVEDALLQDLREDQEECILSLLSEDGASETSPVIEQTPAGFEKPDEILNVGVGEKEKKRARAYAAFKTRWISAYQDVWGFREDYLEGRTLDSEEAFAFLESPALRLFPPDFLESIGVSLLAHEAKITSARVSPLRDAPDHRIIVAFGGSDIEAAAHYAPHWIEEMREDLPIARCCSYADPETRQNPKQPDQSPLEYKDRRGFKTAVRPWPGTVLDILRLRSLWWSRKLGWEASDVVWMLLTGEAPYLNPLKVRVNYTSGKPATVKMEVAAWMPAKTVADVLRRIQREILTVGVGKISERALDVCVFVEENIQDTDESSVWPSLWRRWNETHPDKRYKDHRVFRQSYFRNMPTIVQTYKPPKPSPEAMKKDREFTEQMIRNLEKQASQSAPTVHQPERL